MATANRVSKAKAAAESDRQRQDAADFGQAAARFVRPSVKGGLHRALCLVRCRTAVDHSLGNEAGDDILREDEAVDAHGAQDILRRRTAQARTSSAQFRQQLDIRSEEHTSELQSLIRIS